MHKVWYYTVFSILILTAGCYESPEIAEPSLEGIWLTEDYASLERSNDFRVLMVEIEDPYITFYYNQPNTAWKYEFDERDEIIQLISTSASPLIGTTPYRLNSRGLELEGIAFHGEQDFVKSDNQTLEEYKQEYLLDVYGRWIGTQYSIYFELNRGEQTSFRWLNSEYVINVEESSDPAVIRAIDPEGVVHFWEFELRRNELIIGFPEGVILYERFYEDNVVQFD